MTYLVDKSVLGHLRHPEVRTSFRERLDAGALAISTITLLEQRVSDQSPEDSRRFDRLVLSRVDLVATETVDVDRAREVQAQLLVRSQHRGPSIPDLLVAAVAERQGMTVLHLDRDFEIVAGVTGQPQQRIAELAESPTVPARPPRGTGLLQRRHGSTGSTRYAPRVVCAGCRHTIHNVKDGVVHYHVPSEKGGDLPEGRLAFAHVGCSRTRPVVDYSESSPLAEWLGDLCRGLRVPEASPAVFDLRGTDESLSVL